MAAPTLSSGHKSVQSVKSVADTGCSFRAFRGFCGTPPPFPPAEVCQRSLPDAPLYYHLATLSFWCTFFDLIHFQACY
jgi:hypothetical protein